MGRTAHERLAHLVWVGPCPGGKEQSLGHRFYRYANDNLVGYLAHLTIAVARADQRDGAAHHVKEGFDLGERVFWTAHHNSQFARFCAPRAPGYRRVQIGTF